MKTISVLNIKGGVGKTTTSNNLALGLSKQGFRVLLVDLDPQANTTSMFMSEKVVGGIAEVLLNPESVRDNIVKTKFENLDLIPSNLELAKTERSLLVSHQANYNKLKKMKQIIQNEYNYMIIDCSPVLNILITNALFVTQEVIIPIKVDRFALDGYKTTIEEIRSIEEDHELNIKTKILFTMVSRNNIQKSIIEEFKALPDTMVFGSEIRHQAKPVTQGSFEQKILLEQKANVSSDYQAFVNEYLSMNVETEKSYEYSH